MALRLVKAQGKLYLYMNTVPWATVRDSAALNERLAMHCPSFGHKARKTRDKTMKQEETETFNVPDYSSLPYGLPASKTRLNLIFHKFLSLVNCCFPTAVKLHVICRPMPVR